MTYKDLTPREQKFWANLDSVSKAYPLVRDRRGVLRFESLPVVALLAEYYASRSEGHNLNQLWLEAECNHWPVESVRILYRMMGYSLTGFVEIFADKGDGDL